MNLSNLSFITIISLNKIFNKVLSSHTTCQYVYLYNNYYKMTELVLATYVLLCLLWDFTFSFMYISIFYYTFLFIYIFCLNLSHWCSLDLFMFLFFAKINTFHDKKKCLSVWSFYYCAYLGKIWMCLVK